MERIVTNIDEVIGQLLKDSSGIDKNSDFTFKAPASYINKIEKNNINDPLLKQILPLTIENQQIEGFSENPVGETNFMPVAGILHKYHGRALIMVTEACPIHCRYCFRRHFPYEDARAGKDNWQPIIEYISANKTINEVVLSGGDPLSLNNQKLGALIKKLNAIKHIESIRFHTRLLAILPSRVDAEFIEIIKCASDKIVFIVHINHANEMDDSLYSAINKIKHLGITVFNQSVLLKGVNDNYDSLSRLSKTLFKYGIIPYYLHFLDKVKVGHHFQVEENQAVAIINEMRQKLPGYIVPRLVRENRGDLAKEYIPLGGRIKA
jgi:EF-P beta-lysylation protein EpmB